MKSIILPGAVIVAVIGCALAINATITTNKMQGNLDQERYKRMVAEEQFQKARGAIRTLTIEVEDSREKIQGIQKWLAIGKSMNEDLKRKVASINKEKESLQKERESLAARINRLEDGTGTRAGQGPSANP